MDNLYHTYNTDFNDFLYYASIDFIGNVDVPNISFNFDTLMIHYFYGYNKYKSKYGKLYIGSYDKF
jgi:hypothetical protein